MAGQYMLVHNEDFEPFFEGYSKDVDSSTITTGVYGQGVNNEVRDNVNLSTDKQEVYVEYHLLF